LNKFPEIFRGKFPEIPKLTTLSIIVIANYYDFDETDNDDDDDDDDGVFVDSGCYGRRDAGPQTTCC